MFDTIMRTGPISGLRRGHLMAGFVPRLRVGSFHGSGSAGYTIVTIEPPSSYRLSADPLYMCAPRTRGLALFESFLLPRVDSRLQNYTTKKTAPFRASAEVLANYSTCRYV